MSAVSPLFSANPAHKSAKRIAAPRFGDSRDERLDNDVFTKDADAKSGNSPYGIRTEGRQQYLPISDKRELTETEEKEIHKGLSQWWPSLFPSYSTSMTDMLASPGKSAILSGIAGTGLLALTGLLRNRTGSIFVAIAGLVSALLGYCLRQQQNGNVLDLMKRLPPGATQRDMLSDPAYQSELNRKAMATQARTGMLEPLSAVMLSGALAGSNYKK
jgi:hypothetical protein